MGLYMITVKSLFNSFIANDDHDRINLFVL